MVIGIAAIASQIPLYGVLSVGIGLFLTSVGGYCLYCEVRVRTTGEQSPATLEGEPKFLRAADRAFFWVGSTLLLVIGLGFVLMGYVAIHSCVLGNAAASAC